MAITIGATGKGLRLGHKNVHPKTNEFTLTAWLKFGSLTGSAYGAAIFRGSASTEFQLGQTGSPGNPRFAAFSPGLQETADNTTNRWFHIAFVYASTGVRRKLYKNGILSLSDSTALTTWTDTELILGYNLSFTDQWWPGDIGPVGIFNIPLSQRDVNLQMKKGYPIVTGNDLFDWVDTRLNFLGGPAGTKDFQSFKGKPWQREGTLTYAQEPHNLVYAERKIFQVGFVAAGGDKLFAANMECTADFGSFLKEDRPIAANMQATADFGSFMKADRPLAASIDVSADFAAMARIDRALASFLQATADLGANLNADRPIAASLSATADFSGNINVDRPLAANVTIDADWLAALTVLTGGEVLLAASLLSTADLESFLRVDRPLAANLEATADLLGFARIDRPIAANLNVNADLLAFLRADRPLAANVNVTADWLAALTVLTGGDVLLAVAFLATADFSGNINVERTLAALFQSNADWLAALTITNLIIVVPFDPNITDEWTIPGGGRTFTIPGGGRTYTIPK